MPQDIKTIKYGNHERKTFSKTREVLPLPNLIEVQKSSYQMFLDQGIREVFEDFSPIEDFAGVPFARRHICRSAAFDGTSYQ